MSVTIKFNFPIQSIFQQLIGKGATLEEAQIAVNCFFIRHPYLADELMKAIAESRLPIEFCEQENFPVIFEIEGHGTDSPSRSEE